MYQFNADIDTPPDETVIWRYIDLERLLALLGNSSLYLRRLDLLPDKWEGLWPKPILETTGSWFDETAAFGKDSFIAFLKKSPKTFFVTCWHENVTESAAFWGQNGNSRGLAIRSTIGRLKECSRSLTNFFIGRVKYVDYDRFPPAMPSHALFPAFLKRRGFEHEREVRVLQYQLPSSGDEEKVEWSKTPESSELPVDLTVLIESVYISPMSPA